MAATEDPASSRAYAALRRSILLRDILPGEVLSRPALAARLGVSQTPLRDALSRLEREGFVTVRPRSRTLVAPICLVAVHEARVLRKLLEVGVVARLARDPGRFDLGRAEALAGPDGFERADGAFHRALFAAVGMGGLWDRVQPLMATLDRCRALAPVDVAAAERGHRDILGRIAAGDVPGAEAAMAAHLADELSGLADWRRVYPEMFGEGAL